MSKNPNIFLVGPMGAGKSTIGRMVAKFCQMDFYDTDEVIELRTGASIAWIFDVEGESGFRDREEKVIDELTRKQNIVIATGGGSIVRTINRDRLSARGTVVFLSASLEQQFARTRRDEKRPLLQTNDVHQRIEDLWNERLPQYGQIADLTFETGGKSIRDIALNIAEGIKNVG